MSASLRVEVQSTVGGSPSDSPPKTFAQEKADREAAAAKFREDAKRFREETGTGGTDSVADERERKKKIALENRQERDESFAIKQEMRAQRERQRQQERDENFADRQEAQDRKREASEEKAKQRQQDRDEAYADKQQMDDRRRAQANDPAFLAQRMREQFLLREATRQEYIKQMGGTDPNGFMNRSANMIQNATSLMSRLFGGRGGPMAQPGQLNRVFGGLNTSVMGSVRSFGLLGAIIGGFGAAVKHARETLLAESRRVAQFSGVLRMQEVRNTMRDMRTDRQIASEFGEQMANTSDRQNRQENAWRLIGTRMASVVDKLAAPFSEIYTQILEFIAGSNDTNADLAKHMGLIVRASGQTVEELKKLGVSNRDLRDYAEAVKVAEDVIKSMGSSGFVAENPIKQFEENTLYGLAPGAANPGIIPDILPKDWKGRAQWQHI